MLLDLNRSVCEVVTGVTVSECSSEWNVKRLGADERTRHTSISGSDLPWIRDEVSLFAAVIVDSISLRDMYRSIEERTLVYFSDNPTYLLEAYANSGEGLDRAGGFAIQVRSPRCPIQSRSLCRLICNISLFYACAGSGRHAHPKGRRRLQQRCRLPCSFLFPCSRPSRGRGG